jgi:hypothetical protein
MDQATEHEAAPIEELLSAYRGLQSQFDLVRERLRRAEDNRHTVARRIYDRVRLDYDRELDAIRARLTPLRDELDRLHESIEAQRGEVAAALQAVEEELAETEFRHRIGEYPDHTYVEMRGALDGRAGEARARQATLQSALEAIAAMRSPEPADTAAAPETAPEPVEAPAETFARATEIDPFADDPFADEPITPVATTITDDLTVIVVDEPPTLERALEPAATPVPEPATPEPPVMESRAEVRPVITVQGSPRNDSFENPQQWVRDIGSDATRAERRVRLSAPAPVAPRKPSVSEEIDSVLAPLNAQAATPAIVERAARASTSTAPAAPDLPSLVFVSGPHTGQAIALLPTTLTIGREHDNNVEIKDPEVARYHARILRERDDFVVEDLNSTTGTWVNGERKSRAVLSHGDVIRVGQTELALDFEWTTDSR